VFIVSVRFMRTCHRPGLAKTKASVQKSALVAGPDFVSVANVDQLPIAAPASSISCASIVMLTDRLAMLPLLPLNSPRGAARSISQRSTVVPGGLTANGPTHGLPAAAS